MGQHNECGVGPSSIVRSKGGNDCGWCCFRPKCLQRLATSKWFLFWIAWAGGFQSFLINGLLNVVVSTIERRYELSSTDSGLIVGAYDISSFLTLLPISYLGGRRGACKPKWVGYGILLLGIGSFVFASPHFFSGLYQARIENSRINTCLPPTVSLNSTCTSNDNAEQEHLSLQRLKYVFLIAQLIMGIGGSPLYTLGTAYIDENVAHKMQPVYSGVFYACTMFGPALGYIAGGQLLRIYVDFGSVNRDGLQISPASDVWVGAWWLGFVIIGTLLCFASIPLLAFPSELPDTKELPEAQSHAEQSGSRKAVNSLSNVSCESEGSGNRVTDESVMESLREFPKAIKDLWKRWTFLFICFEQSCGALLLAGFGAFVPKIIESQFGVSSSTASLIVGSLVIPCGCGGSYLGGYLIKKFSMTPKAILRFSFLIAGANCFCSFAFMVYCPNVEFVGVTIPYADQRTGLNLVSSCNMKCSCSEDRFEPICGFDNKIYFSPCHAGCVLSHQISSGVGVDLGYSNCSCIALNETRWMRLLDGRELEIAARQQKCTSPGCTYQIYVFTTLFFLYLGLIFLNSMPMLSATLRSVPSDRRAFALGIQMLIWRLLGAIPGPIIFGRFIDSACVLWTAVASGCDESTTDSGSCLAYDNLTFSRSMLGIALSVSALTFLFAGLAWCFYTSAENEQENEIRRRHSAEAELEETFSYHNPIVCEET